MTRVLRHIAVLAAAATLAGPAAAAEGETEDFVVTFSEARARIFSDVCMASAPGFETWEARALAAGFEPAEGSLRFEEILTDLVPDETGELCGCRMTMYAPHFPTLLVTMVDRLRADFPAYRSDDSLKGKGYSSIFERDRQEVVLELNPEKFEEFDMLAGWVVARGGCPA